MEHFRDAGEDFLHFVWRTRHFNPTGLADKAGRPVQILHPGTWNHDQGPDFLFARIRIGGMDWHGHVEIHLRSEDWYKHGHQEDPRYDNTVLHVVLDSGLGSVRRSDGTEIPEVGLSGRIPESLLTDYDRLRLSQDAVPCAGQLSSIPGLLFFNWAERLAIERMEQKVEKASKRLEETVTDWDQLLWEEAGAMLAGPVNQEALRTLCKRIPFRLLKKYGGNRQQQEALLYGACGLLASRQPSGDEYYSRLRAEWQFLREKHGIRQLPYVQLRFLRMRPAAFPTIRISQLVSLAEVFPVFTDQLNIEGFGKLLRSKIEASTYWDTHYRFGEEGKAKKKRLGASQKQILIINTLVPLGWMYARAHGRPDPGDIAEKGMAGLPPERNRITEVFAEFGFKPENSLQSQGIIQLKKRYCDEKRCLACGIGHYILKGGAGTSSA